MILKETILSAFTERGTLLKWLKKVEAALNADVLTDISVEQIDDTHVKLKFTFENGVFVESPVLTLARGKDGDAATIRVGSVTTGEATTPASVVNVGTESAAVFDFVIPRGRDGLDGEGIAATVEIGTVTTGAAGTDASVVNVGNEQRAVLNFVIPRGDPGEPGAPGESGSAGVGFDDADQLSINDGNINITADDNGINIEASFEVVVGEEILEIPSTMYLPLKGSESIVIDVDESGDFIEIHLDADIAAKLGRVLVTPMSAPASVSLVAVDTSNAQTMLTLGDGLSVSDGVLSASGGGGGGVSFEALFNFDFLSAVPNTFTICAYENGVLQSGREIHEGDAVSSKMVGFFSPQFNASTFLKSGKIFAQDVGIIDATNGRVSLANCKNKICILLSDVVLEGEVA